MQNRCPNCCGELQFDATSGKLKCIYCDSIFDANAFEDKTKANEESDFFDMNATIYTCPTCGAQISSLENAAVDYCLYCGSFVTLDKQMKKIKKPDYIIPFSKTKDECRESYKKAISKKLYAPKEFKDEKFLEGFKGIYIPYWTYEYTYGPEVKIPGESEERHGDYVHKKKFITTAHVKNARKEVAFDASSSFDDEMSKKITPFDLKNRKEFSPNYMFGYFGDTADVEKEIYRKEADKVAQDEIWNEITSKKELRKSHPQKPNTDTFERNFNLKKRETLTFVPVWFLTWKKNGRIAYSIVNGDNGKIYSEIPVSILRYLVISLISAIPIFFGLNYLFTFSAKNMLTISLGLSALMILLYSAQLDSIVRRRMHADDKGYLAIYEKRDKTEIQTNLFVDIFNLLASEPFISGVGFVALIVIGLLVFSEYTFYAIILLLIVYPIYTLWCIYRQGKQIEDMSVVIDILASYATFIVSGGILLLDPAADVFYYVAAIICLAGIGVSAIRIMTRYNEMITRPVPHFFERKAGDNNA